MRDWQDKATDIVRDKLCEDRSGGTVGSLDCSSSHPVQAAQHAQTEENQQATAEPRDPRSHSFQSKQESKVKEGKTVYYFFSFSMPEESLLNALRDALALRQQGLNVVMVIRGFVNNNMRDTVAAFDKLMREGRINTDLPVDIDPPLYEKYGVTRVPVIVSVSRKGTGKMIGDIGIPYALSRFDNKIKNYGTEGHTYHIVEEDFMKVIAVKQPFIEQQVRERIKDLMKEMYVLKKHDGRFEKATENRDYYVDPSMILTDDVLDHEGKVLFAKGTVFNPTDHVRLDRYIIIDGNDPEQVKFALSGKYRKIMIISGNVAKLTTKHRKMFWFAPDDVLSRFQIRRVPAIFEQEGRYVRVSEKAI